MHDTKGVRIAPYSLRASSRYGVCAEQICNEQFGVFEKFQTLASRWPSPFVARFGSKICLGNDQVAKIVYYNDQPGRTVYIRRRVHCHRRGVMALLVLLLFQSVTLLGESMEFKENFHGTPWKVPQNSVELHRRFPWSVPRSFPWTFSVVFRGFP